MTPADDSAFPTQFKEHGLTYSEGGLTKREIFALAAMQGFCSWNHNEGRKPYNYTSCALEAVFAADELIAELAKVDKSGGSK